MPVRKVAPKIKSATSAIRTEPTIRLTVLSELTFISRGIAYQPRLRSDLFVSLRRKRRPHGSKDQGVFKMKPRLLRGRSFEFKMSKDISVPVTRSGEPNQALLAWVHQCGLHPVWMTRG